MQSVAQGLGAAVLEPELEARLPGGLSTCALTTQQSCGAVMRRDFSWGGPQIICIRVTWDVC